jgi:hypothetical protein
MICSIKESIPSISISTWSKEKYANYLVELMIESNSFIPSKFFQSDIELAQLVYEAYCEAKKNKSDKEAWNNWRRELKSILDNSGIKYPFETKGCKPIEEKKLNWIEFNFDQKLNTIIEQGLVIKESKDQIECSKIGDKHVFHMILRLNREEKE